MTTRSIVIAAATNTARGHCLSSSEIKSRPQIKRVCERGLKENCKFGVMIGLPILDRHLPLIIPLRTPTKFGLFGVHPQPDQTADTPTCLMWTRTK